MIYHKVDNWPPSFYRTTPDGIDLAATVLGRVDGPEGSVRIHVATWEAERGQREDKLTPAEFEDWKRSFLRPSSES